MIFTHEITLDITINQIKTLNMKQYTKDSFVLHVNLTDRGEPFQANKQQLLCYFKMETPDKKHILTNGNIRNDGSVDISIPEKACLSAGSGTAELIFIEIKDETVFATMNLYVNVVASSYQNNNITSSDDFDALNAALIAANKTYDNVIKSAQNSADAAKRSEENAYSSEINAKASETNAAKSALLSKSYAVGDTDLEERPHEDEDCAKYYYEQSNGAARQAANSALMAKSYAIGNTGIDTRPNEDEDCAKHYYEQAKIQAENAETSETNAANSAKLSENYCKQAESISSGLSGALRPLGTISFANLPSLSTVTEGGMYNISDQFITTSDFMEGSGLTIPAGSNIYKTASGKWDVLAGSPVTGIKGNAENSYRKGNVNITPANIGSPTTEYINEHFVPDFASIKFSYFSAGSSWRRVAEHKVDSAGGYNVNSFVSCNISIKRGYNSPAPEFHETQLVGSDGGMRFINVINSGNIIFKKIRLVWVAAELKYYLEVYYSGTYANGTTITIKDATGDINHKERWKTITPVEVPESAAGSAVLAQKDISGQFTLESLVKKTGDTITGKLNVHGGMSLDSSTTASSNLQYLLGIDSFTEGGTVHWQAAENAKVGEAAKATKDGNGNNIASTYLKNTGGTVNGALTVSGETTLQGNVRIKKSNSNYGSVLNIGDGDYVHISEPTDDNLEIKAKNINFVTSNTSSDALTLNGKPLLDGVLKCKTFAKPINGTAAGGFTVITINTELDANHTLIASIPYINFHGYPSIDTYITEASRTSVSIRVNNNSNIALTSGYVFLVLLYI